GKGTTGEPPGLPRRSSREDRRGKPGGSLARRLAQRFDRWRPYRDVSGKFALSVPPAGTSNVISSFSPGPYRSGTLFTSSGPPRGLTRASLSSSFVDSDVISTRCLPTTAPVPPVISGSLNSPVSFGC